MQKRWVLLSKKNPVIAERLRAELGVHSVLADLLSNRGVDSFEAARQFFRPSLSDLHDPFSMKDMDMAISRIEKAIGDNEKILIYGDYDVDGTTAVALVFGFFRQFHSRIEYYLPDRYEEGYGLSIEGVDYASANGFTLIITLDCGIKDHEKVQYAREQGIDVIIGDHHLPGDTLPEAYAVLDPKRADCCYPFKDLSGCGIGFKIVQAFIAKNKMDMEAAYQFLDLVAVSIASDIVSVTGENRILAHFGLKKLNANPCCGLQSLIELSAAKDRELTVNDILFQVGPRINAAGRIDHARDAVRLLLSKSLQEASVLREGIDEQNTQRKDLDHRITEEALSLLEAQIGNSSLSQPRMSTVLFKADWHKGVIGIVASRLIEKHYRPTVVLTQTNGHVTGSARSIHGVDLYEALSECHELLDQYGGHKYAAGLTMKRENIPLFQKRFEEVVAKQITADMLVPEIAIDAMIHLSEIDARFYRVLRQFEPFGPQHEEPIFLSERVSVSGPAEVVGGNHLKMKVIQDGSPEFSCIGFGLGHLAPMINTGKPFDICYVLEENVWRTRKNLQMNIKDIRI